MIKNLLTRVSRAICGPDANGQGLRKAQTCGMRELPVSPSAFRTTTSNGCTRTRIYISWRL